MKNISILFFAIFTITFVSCNDKKKSEEPEVVTVDRNASDAKTHEIAKTDAVFKDPNVEAIYNQYIQLENGLVNTDAVATAKAASRLKETIVSIDDDPSTLRVLGAMANTDDIEVQRLQFVALNTAMEDILDGALTSGTIYKQYCPMAFNNTGASWFSSSKEILNPFFGNKMLKCGRVDAEIQ